jgi:hypothetical protein
MTLIGDNNMLVSLNSLYNRHFFKKSTQVEGRSGAQLMIKYAEKGEDELSLGLWDRFLASCTKIPVHDNFYLSWWLRGLRGFDPETNPAMAPPFLTKDGFTKLKVRQ